MLSSSSKSSLKESSRALVVHKNDDDFAFFLGKRHFFKGPLFFLCRLFRVCVKKEAFFYVVCICVYPPHKKLFFMTYTCCF